MAKQINIKINQPFGEMQEQFVGSLSSIDPVFGTNVVFYKADALMRLTVYANGFTIGSMYVKLDCDVDTQNCTCKHGIVFFDAFGNMHKLIAEDGGKIETSDVELAQKIQNIYIDFANRMFK